MAEFCAELVNVHFEENRKRQGLTVLTDECPEDGDGSVENSKKEDKSRKGSVDHRILTLVNLINSTECFFTTSSCSGRAILFTHAETELSSETGSTSSKPKGGKGHKRGCKWIFVTHDEVNESEFLQAWSITDFKEVCYKVEPSILHIQCKCLTDAKKLLHAATESGFRNSGMVIGKDNKITVAVRSAMSLEVPLTTPAGSLSEEGCEDGQNFVNKNFLCYLAAKGNEKLIDNWSRTDKFTNEFRRVFIL